VANLQLKKKEK